MNIHSNILDVPRQFGDDDFLGIDNYGKALESFIKIAETPMTVAIQGEWGSGKTSMMNQIKGNLCDKEELYHSVWLNTWQYSLFTDENTSMIRIIKGIFDQVVGIIEKDKAEPNPKIEASKKILGGILRGAVSMGSSMVGASAIADEAFKAVDSLNGSGTLNQATVHDLRRELGLAINEFIASDKTRKGFLVFIDDLDRIEPVVAVNILELLKNIFDIEHCLFILAIDYDIVVKGLKPKFGEPTPQNEREFRSFFDKIIQLPFTMPVHGYRVDTFLINSLSKIGYFDEKTLKDEKATALISEMSSISVGKNPRAMKRLTNILSLIKIFNQLSFKSNDSNDEFFERMMNFGLICLQLAYPRIYEVLSADTNLENWTMAKAEAMGFEVIDEKTKNKLAIQQEFDEDWEQFLYIICQEDSYLQNNALNISNLINLIKNQLPIERADELPEVLAGLLALSAVTSVSIQNSTQSEVKGRNEYFDGIDAWKKSKVQKDGILEDNMGIQTTYEIDRMFKSFCSLHKLTPKITYTGMVNFFFQNQRAAAIVTWMNKSGAVTMTVNVPFDSTYQTRTKVLVSKGSKKPIYQFKVHSVEDLKEFWPELSAFLEVIAKRVH